MVSLINAAADTPEPSEKWTRLTEQQRKWRVTSILSAAGYSTLMAVGTTSHGVVILSMSRDPGASERGWLLLDAEEALNEFFGGGLQVWLEPAQDKNPLRKLRGVDVKLWREEA